MKGGENMQEETTINLNGKNITDENNIFQELLSAYPNLVNLDLSDNQITKLPEDLSSFTKLQYLDISNNPFESVSK